MTDSNKGDIQPASNDQNGAGWQPLHGLRRQIDRLFEDFERPSFSWGRSLFEGEPTWLKAASPLVDVAEQDNAYVISAELPGLDEKDVSVTVKGRQLLISGEKKDKREEKKKGYFLSERRYGSFQRSFTLPEWADTENVSAHFDKGVLTLTVAKKPGAQTGERKIDIQSS